MCLINLFREKNPILSKIFDNKINLISKIHGLLLALEELYFYERVNEEIYFKNYYFDLKSRNILI